MDKEPKVDLKRRPRVVHVRGWYPTFITLLVAILLSAGNIGYTIQISNKRAETERRARAAVVQAERKADQRWCQLLVPLDDSYQSNPTIQSTPLGRAVATAIHNIRLEIGC